MPTEKQKAAKRKVQPFTKEPAATAPVLDTRKAAKLLTRLA